MMKSCPTPERGPPRCSPGRDDLVIEKRAPKTPEPQRGDIAPPGTYTRSHARVPHSMAPRWGWQMINKSAFFYNDAAPNGAGSLPGACPWTKAG
jgi:hypothetical protein